MINADNLAMRLSFRLRKLLKKTHLKMNRTSGYIKSADLIMFVMLNKYNMYKNLPLILVSLCFFSCTSEDQNFINIEIETQLKSKENVVNVFLDIKFGMNKHQFDSCISAHVTTGKITIDLDYAYQFNDNSNLIF